jgi:hypothetical protein
MACRCAARRAVRCSLPLRSKDAASIPHANLTTAIIVTVANSDVDFKLRLVKLEFLFLLFQDKRKTFI